MTWNFRLMRTPKGVAVHYFYYSEGSSKPVSCSATPFVAEAADVDDLRFLLQKIMDDAMENPVLDGVELGFFESDQEWENTQKHRPVETQDEDE
ncbi:hypothetical protein [Gimesia chilikensis]|uniref:hypothetical protein n=1 Tax=Gimesia chilikensis TaxID=2605989 RepID=UPI003A8FC8A7